MSNPFYRAARKILAVAVADLRDRTRGYAFWVVMALIIIEIVEMAVGNTALTLGGYRTAYSSSWVGLMVALDFSFLSAFFGFYVVNNSIKRDIRTRVGPILASSSLGKGPYLIGKWLSNLSVLSMFVAIEILGALAVQLSFHEDLHIVPMALTGPFLWFALPSMAVASAVAVLFESVWLLREGLGNLLYFLLVQFTLPAISNPRGYFVDWTGFQRMFRYVQAFATKSIPGFRSSSPLGVGSGYGMPVEIHGLHMERMPFTLSLMAGRLVWCGVAGALVATSILLFRYPQGEPKGLLDRLFGRFRRERDTPPDQFGDGVSNRSVGYNQVFVATAKRSFVSLYAAQFRLMLRGNPRWWYSVAFLLAIAPVFARTQHARYLAGGRMALASVDLVGDGSVRDRKSCLAVVVYRSPADFSAVVNDLAGRVEPGIRAWFPLRHVANCNVELAPVGWVGSRNRLHPFSGALPWTLEHFAQAISDCLYCFVLFGTFERRSALRFYERRANHIKHRLSADIFSGCRSHGVAIAFRTQVTNAFDALNFRSRSPCTARVS